MEVAAIVLLLLLPQRLKGVSLKVDAGISKCSFCLFLTPFGNSGRVERKRQAMGPFAHDTLLWKPTLLCKPTFYYCMETEIGYMIFSSTTSEAE